VPAELPPPPVKTWDEVRLEVRGNWRSLDWREDLPELPVPVPLKDKLREERASAKL